MFQGYFEAGFVALAVGLALAFSLPAPAFAQSVEATRALSRGMIVTLDDVALSDREARRGEAQRFDQVIGKEVKRSVYRGRAIRLASLGAPTLVERNDIVELTYRAGTLSLRAEGRAMRAGGMGELVRVMNLDSRTIITGRISGPGRVEVAP